MAYKLFEAKPSGGDFISLHKNGLRFGRAIVAQYLNNAKYVELYFDEELQAIGIKPLIEKTEHAFLILGKKTKHIRAKDFMETFRCGPAKAKRCSAVWKDDAKLLELKI